MSMEQNTTPGRMDEVHHGSSVYPAISALSYTEIVIGRVGTHTASAHVHLERWDDRFLALHRVKRRIGWSMVRRAMAISIRQRGSRLEMLLGLAFVGTGAWLFTLKSQTAVWPSTLGTVSDVAMNVANRNCVPLVAYSVAGHRYTFADTAGNGPYDACSLSAGHAVTVRYNPSKPWQGYVSRSDRPNQGNSYGYASFTVAAGAVIGVIGTLGERRNRQRRKGKLRRGRTSKWSVTYSAILDADAMAVIRWWTHPDRLTELLRETERKGGMDVTLSRDEEDEGQGAVLRYRTAKGWEYEHRLRSNFKRDQELIFTDGIFTILTSDFETIRSGQCALTATCQATQEFERLGEQSTELFVTHEHTMTGGRWIWRWDRRRFDHTTRKASFEHQVQQCRLATARSEGST